MIAHSAKIVRWLLGAIFVVAGVLKIAGPAAFHADLVAYEIPVSDFALRLIAVTFPFLELFCGAALLTGFWPETVGAVVAGMGLIFVLMLAQAVWRGLELKCGCLGDGDSGWFDQPPVALARAALLLGAAVWSWLKSGGTRATDSVASSPGSLPNP